MKLMLALAASALVTAVHGARSQPPTRTDSADLHYYDRWPGLWHRVLGNGVDSLPSFEIRRGPGNSFLEHWYLTIDGKVSRSFGLRSWDPSTAAWKLVWVADPDHFQIWDGVRYGDGWYVIRTFSDGSDSFISRQAWIIQGADRLLRTIERSTDDGRTWSIRYRDVYQRIQH